MDFRGSELKLLRKVCSLTCEDLATLCGVSKQTISNWENEKTPMTKVVKVGIFVILLENYPKEVKIWLRLNEEDEKGES